MKREFTGVFIPAHIWTSNLLPAEKMLLGEVASLSVKTGWCDASRDHFAEWLHCDETNVTHYVKKLERLGFLEVARTPGYRNKMRVVNDRFFVDGVVNPIHGGGEPHSRGVVNPIHGGGEPHSPEIQDKYNYKTERESAPAQGVEHFSLNPPNKNDNFRGAGPAETGPQISYLDRPGARTPAEMVDAMRRFYREYPGEAEAGLMNNAKARRYNQDQRERITSEWAAHVIKTNHGSDTYQMLNADLQAWFLRQPQFEKQAPAQQQETPRRRELKTA